MFYVSGIDSFAGSLKKKNYPNSVVVLLLVVPLMGLLQGGLILIAW